MADEQALADEAARMRDEIVRVDVFEKVGPLEGQEGYEEALKTDADTLQMHGDLMCSALVELCSARSS